jgi:hypothetical protein
MRTARRLDLFLVFPSDDVLKVISELGADGEASAYATERESRQTTGFEIAATADPAVVHPSRQQSTSPRGADKQ